jgi:anti-sigma B factor antagonist
MAKPGLLSDAGAVLVLTECRHVPWTVLAVAGELDVDTAAQLRVRLWATLGNAYAAQLVIDLTEVGFMDVAGLHVLCEARHLVEGVDGQLRLVCPQERLLRLFRLTGLDRTLYLCSRLEEALV